MVVSGTGRAAGAGAVGVGVVAWGVAFVIWNPDFDEVAHAHAIWLIGEGLVPFRDFFECRLPLPWYLHLPLLALLPEGPEALFGLRLFSVAGHGVWLGLLIATLRRLRPELPAHWFALGVPALLASELGVEYLVEFRPDGWSYVPLFAGIHLFETRERWPRALRFAALGAGCSLAVLSVPKLYPLPPLYAALVLLRDARAGRPLAPAIAATALGVAGAALAVTGGLALAGVDLRLAWDASIVFHRELLRGSSFGHGTARAFAEQRVPLLFAVCGAAAFGFEHLRRRRWPTPFELALVATALFSLATLRPPYKQYVTPLYLILLGLVPYLGLVLRARRPRLEAAACVVALALVVLGNAGAIARVRSESLFPQLLLEQRRLLELSRADERVVVPPPFHPIFRRDASYAWTNAWEPGGRAADRVLAALDHPRLSPTHTSERIEAELEAEPPAVAMLSGPPFQTETLARTLAGFLERHRDDYARVEAPFFPVFVRRPQSGPGEAGR